MRTTLWLDLRRPLGEVVALAALAEAAGWDAVRLGDQAGTPGALPRQSPSRECWAVVGALAAALARVHLQVVVDPARGRHPAVVAKLASTVDRLSGGRILLGLASSADPSPDPQAGSGAQPDAESRLSEQAEVIRRLSSGGPVTFRGDFYRLDQAPLDPPTWQHPFPLLLLGGSATGAAAWADQWEVEAPLERATAQLAALDGAARRRLTISAAVEQPENPQAWAGLGVSELVVPDAALGDDPQGWRHALDRLRAPAAAVAGPITEPG